MPAFHREMALTIMPILRRELTTAARKGQLQQERASFAAILLAIVLGTFAAWYFPGGRVVGRDMMSQVAAQTFIFVFAAHAISLLAIMVLGALSIAAEMDRKTLGFLLATRLSNAEIVLGKLAACAAGFFASLAAGLPVVILLNVLGGVDPRLILLAYGGLCSTAFLVVAIAIWVSTGRARRSPGGHRARCSGSSPGHHPGLCGNDSDLVADRSQAAGFRHDAQRLGSGEQSPDFVATVHRRRRQPRRSLLHDRLDERSSGRRRHRVAAGGDRPASQCVSSQRWW